MDSYMIITFIFYCLLQLVKGEIRSAHACFSNATDINIQCEYGSMLRIHKAFFGYNPQGRCSYRPGDCVYQEHENYACVGRKFCSINLPSGRLGRTIPSCKRESNYFQVDYECVPKTKTQSICENRGIKAQSGYLASPSYPNNYPGNMDCSTTIKVNQNQNIKLYIIDMDLETNNSLQCLDWLYARDGARSVTLCGRRGNEPIQIMWNELFVQLVSNGIENHKGFWLYYEADPPLYTTRKTTQRLTTASPTVIPIQTIPITKTNTILVETEDNKLPFAAIIGGVIGTLSFILLVLLFLLGLKWWKEHRRRMDKNRFIEVQNPAYRNSTEFRNSKAPNDNFYNYIDC